MLLVMDIKGNQRGVSPFFQTLDFCLTIPRDRFTEIERDDRDGYRYNMRTANILWSGLELCEVLVKRLEKVTRYSCRSTETVEKLNELLAEKLPQIPTAIVFPFNEPLRLSDV
jgi:hypothetical protein